MKRLIVTIWLLVASFNTLAHKPSDSYLTLSADDQQITGQWDIALRDLDYALGLDANDDGNITWAELRNSREVVYAYALSRLEMTRGKQVCVLQAADLLVDEHSDGHYAVLNFQASCPPGSASLSMSYRLFFDLDPQHRGLLSLIHQGLTETFIFSPDRQQNYFPLNKDQSSWRTLADFAYEGIWHIWIGFDHMLFLLSLLLPAALIWNNAEWQPKSGFKPVFFDVLGVVTAFTLAHSLTLSLTVLHYISLPSRWVESAIAASVVLAALNNIYPVLVKRRTWFAFAFGLIHGMGIASVLLDMGLPDTQRMLPLLGFNLGVEAGQLAIVGVVLPLIVGFSRYRYYPLLVMKTGSVSIVTVALVWLAERSLDFQMNIF
ncbi:HupE/UreJ family protein [Methylomonas rosea]|uniref:HupE/UreJ family protein n=1 Tax=Methylomonas rosea TaxID=2952227 RepID=A0ABT1TP45_9GAMM|nr:HupE/UreJ family protein [Methylomonas sp. WSC-7]MCQ8116540.1 HupE/UreJ family protein [Methylomonas sp. WSC-7]